MKTEKEVITIIDDTIENCIGVVPSIKKAIDNRDWATVIEYCNAIIAGACLINAAEGLLE